MAPTPSSRPPPRWPRPGRRRIILSPDSDDEPIPRLAALPVSASAVLGVRSPRRVKKTRARALLVGRRRAAPDEDLSCQDAGDDVLSYHQHTATASGRRQTQERFLLDSMSQANHPTAATGLAAARPEYNPLAWPNELRRAQNFYPNFRKRILKKLFHPDNKDPRCLVRKLPFTTAQLLAQPLSDFVDLNLKVIDHSLKIVDVDGNALLYFIKGGLNYPFEYQDRDLAKDPSLQAPGLEAISLKAFRDLTRVYSPPHPKFTDSRHNDNRECNAPDITTGLYHFGFWQQNGHDFVEEHRHTLEREGFLSLDCYPDHKKLGGIMKVGSCVNKFFQQMAPITQAIGSLFEVLDPVNYNRYKERYDELVAGTSLSTLNYSRHASFAAHACLVGLLIGLHRDSRDTSDGWVSDICFGDFDGGNLQVPQTGLELKLRGSDALFMRSKILAHGVSQVSRGVRYSQVSFTHHGLIDTVAEVARRG